jgi:uncharacterized protein (TIGR02246 family)
MNKNTNQEKDLAAIERLHEKDTLASKAGDFATLRSIMTDDAVVMPPKGKWIRGKAELDASFRNMEQAMRQMEVLEYVEDFEEVKVFGDYAFEWGTIRGAMRSKSEIERSSYKVMRILQKQPDGEWKVHRTIWNDNPSESTK